MGTAVAADGKSDVRRVLIVRHGERLDHIDTGWYKSPEDMKNKKHCNWPAKLPTLGGENTEGLDAVNDAPLSAMGVYMSELIGACLARSGYDINIVISSPAFRCIMTTHHILSGYKRLKQGNTDLTGGIKIEPGWFEWGFEQTVLMPLFMEPKTITQQCAYQIDEAYDSIIKAKDMNPMETYLEFQERCKTVVSSILDKYKGPPAPQMLIVTHAPCMDAFRHATNAPLRQFPEWSRIVPKVPYLAMLLWEEDPQKGWTLLPPPVENLSYAGNPHMDMEAYLNGFTTEKNK